MTTSHLSLVPPADEVVTSPAYVLHVRKGATRTLCGKRIERTWWNGSKLPLHECTPCRRMNS